MAYTPNIPAAGDYIGDSQAQIQANFNAIDSGVTGSGIGLDRNHITMTDGTNGGLHNRVDYFQVPAVPDLSGYISSAYPKTVVVTTPASSNTELFYKNAGRDTQVTSSALVSTSGEGYIPGGLQIRASSQSGVTSGDTITFSKQFPTACISVTCNSDNASATALFVSNLSATGFKVNRSGSGAFTFYYTAIGY